MARKRDECCWCRHELTPKRIQYMGSYRGKPKKSIRKVYPRLCPDCTKRKEIREKFDGWDVKIRE